MLTPFQTYTTFVNLKNHFRQRSYDYIKYQGKSRLNEASFNGRGDKVFFQKLSKHKECFNFILANLLEDDSVYVRDLAYGPEGERIYSEWLRRQESLTYLFEQDLTKIDNLQDEFRVRNNQHPILFQRYLRKEIMLETICILLDVTGLQKIWDKKMGEDPIWESEGHKILKYTPFIKIEKNKFRKIIVAKLKEK